MTRSRLPLIAACCLLTGAAVGWFAGRLPERTYLGSDATASHAPAAVASAEGLPHDAAQARVDAQAAIASPVTFLDSLTRVPSLQATARIAAAVAVMALPDVQRLAQAMEVRQFGRDPRTSQLTSAVYERWAELDTEGLLEAARLSPNRLTVWLGGSAAFRKLAEADPEAAWKRAQDAGPLTSQAKQAVLASVAERDPSEAVKMAMTDKMSRLDGWAVSNVFQTWAARDPEAAKTAFEKLPRGEVRNQVMAYLSSTLATMDADAALAWGQTLTNASERRSVLSQALERIAGTDPQRALAMLDDPKFASSRESALTSVAQAWAKRDFDGALSWVMASKSPADRQRMLSALNYEATADQRSKLLAIAEKLPPSAAKDIYQSALQSYWGSPVDGEALLQGVKSPALKEQLLVQAMDRYGNAEEKQRYFEMLQPSSRTAAQASNIAAQLSWSDPQGALKWAEALESPDQRKAATLSALGSWASSDPAGAAAKAVALEDADQRQRAVSSVMGSWLNADDKGARAWMETLAGPDRSAALGALVGRSAGASPEEAQGFFRQFASSLDEAGLAKSENKAVARSLAQTLTENDPQQAISWAQGLGAGAMQGEAYAGIAEKWAGYDPVATSQWVGSLPAGEGRDLAAGRLVGAIAHDDPESAWAWATSISDRAKRREAAAQTLEAWKAHGQKDAATSALNAGSFTPDELEELRKKLE